MIEPVSSFMGHRMVLEILRIKTGCLEERNCNTSTGFYSFFHAVVQSPDFFFFFFKAVATVGFVEQPPFGILPSVFELAPGQTTLVEVGN